MKTINHALYLNLESINEEKIIESKLGVSVYRLGDLWDFENILCGFDSLVAEPQYFNEELVRFIQEKKIKCLYLEGRIISGFLKKS